MSAALWAAGDAYEPFMGRWSRLVAREFVAWLSLSPGSRWLDVGCGTGALSQAILEAASPGFVRGIDPSAAFVEFARSHVTGAEFSVGDAQGLDVGDSSFDAAVAGLVLNHLPDPARAATELRRVIATGGTAAAYVWDYAGEMQMLRRFWDASVALDPSAIEKDQGARMPLCKPGPLEELFARAGLVDVEVARIDVPTVFKDFDDYWTPFLGGQAPAPAYAVSLDEDRRTALRERLRETLPVEPDGSVHLLARAWAVRGRRAVA